ncbi:hypothetical protein GCM10022197_32350 [Microlunatus spumicola]|uniref:Uncharacterized protein n=1 Tax=Microlunatus spumicola TaxID=81499 RepID=A0ABP6XXR3_9ACTN
MIIWSRWGILILVAVGLGVGTGALLDALLLPGRTNGPSFSMFMGVGLIAAAVYTYLLDRYVLRPHLDKPQQQFVLQPLPERVGNQTHRQIPVVNPQTGQPVYVQPRSSLFFVPVRIWPFVLAGIGILVTIVNAIALIARG